MDIIKKIKSGAYWRVIIRPTIFNEYHLSSLSEIHNLVEDCKIRLRGWDYPHVDRVNTRNGESWVESICDSGHHIEFWRFYQSGQFLHYFAVAEDYIPETKEYGLLRVSYSDSETNPKGYLSIFSTLFRITEIYEFAKRLALKNIFTSSIKIKIELHNIKQYQLFFWQRDRDLADAYITSLNEIKMESVLAIEELLTKGQEEALNKTIHLFERFNWNNPPRGILLEEQNKLLERRL